MQGQDVLILLFYGIVIIFFGLSTYLVARREASKLVYTFALFPGIMCLSTITYVLGELSQNNIFFGISGMLWLLPPIILYISGKMINEGIDIWQNPIRIGLIVIYFILGILSAAIGPIFLTLEENALPAIFIIMGLVFALTEYIKLYNNLSERNLNLLIFIGGVIAIICGVAGDFILSFTPTYTIWSWLGGMTIGGLLMIFSFRRIPD